MSEDLSLKVEAAFNGVHRAEEDRLLIQAQGSEHLMFEYLRVLHPGLIEYRGGLFIEEQFDQAVVDDILKHSEDAEPIIAAQAYMNAFHLGQADDAVFDPVLARAIAASIAYNWGNWVRDRFGRDIVSTIDIGELSGAVWFRAAP